MNAATASAILCLILAALIGVAVVIGATRNRRRLPAASAFDTYMATRRAAFTGRRATDLCPDPDCRLASRAHLRRDCGNLSVQVGDWPPTPDPVTQGLADREARLYPDTSGFAVRLQDGQPSQTVTPFAPLRAHVDAGLCRDRAHRGWPGARVDCPDCRAIVLPASMTAALDEAISNALWCNRFYDHQRGVAHSCNGLDPSLYNERGYPYDRDYTPKVPT